MVAFTSTNAIEIGTVSKNSGNIPTAFISKEEPQSR